MLRDTEHSWGTISKGLHWGMAILILCMFVLGWMAASWPLSPTKLKLFFWHKSIGIAVLALALLRLIWRWRNPIPSLPVQISAGQRHLARMSHALLYAMLLLIPLSGWVINSAANFPFKVFGWFTLPAIAPHSEAVQAAAEAVHLSGFWILCTLLIIHIGAALQHQFIYKNNVLTRMLPFW